MAREMHLSGWVVVLACILAVIDPSFAYTRESILPRAYAPPHIPMTSVPPTPVFEIPWWLGGYVASVNESSNWTLPLTYPNGGRTNIGVTLVIQNQGPYNITLYTTSPETIQGSSSYLVIADSTVQILAAQDWIVVSSTYGATSNDGNFDYLQAQNASISCSLAVGDAWNTSVRSDILGTCGTFLGLRLVMGPVPSAPARFGQIYAYRERFPTSSFDYVSLMGASSYLPNSTYSNNAQMVHTGAADAVTAYGDAITGVSYFYNFQGTTYAGHFRSLFTTFTALSLRSRRIGQEQ